MSLIVDILKRAGGFVLDVSFETEGGVHALLGSSGSGKSMTLKCIAGILTPDEGHISLDGRVLFDSGKKIDLPPQKRRVAMARIAAQEPSLILLDEPFSALDSNLKWVLENEMKTTLDEMRIPAVMVTHSRDEVYRLCTSVCCLRDGRSESTMAMRDFFRDPQTVTGAMLSGCKNVSPAVRIGPHTLRAALWGVDLYFRGGIPADVPLDGLTVGIRAHRFHAEQRPDDDNEFRVGEFTVLADPFEWNVSFCAGEAGCAPLLWRTAKSEGGLLVPEKLYLSSKDILLLRE